MGGLAPMTFTLRRIIWPDGHNPPDDCNVIHDDKIVSRIYRMTSVAAETWRWTMTGEARSF